MDRRHGENRRRWVVVETSQNALLVDSRRWYIVADFQHASFVVLFVCLWVRSKSSVGVKIILNVPSNKRLDTGYTPVESGRNCCRTILPSLTFFFCDILASTPRLPVSYV